MTSEERRPALLPYSLSQLRLRLTAWYVGTFFVILMLLGIGMFAAITRRFDRDLDASLRQATHELIRAVQFRARAIDPVPLLNPSTDLGIPDRTLSLVDSAGRLVAGSPVEPWIGDLARDAWKNRSVGRSHSSQSERLLRAYAERFPVVNGQSLVAVAVADEIELEDRYASLIASFSAAALVALVLVAAGGWFLARQSTAPVERTIAHMRRFMADAAHELRTPLTVVRSRAEVALQRPREAPEYVSALRGIEREVDRVGRIVEDLLMLARADAGERPIDRRRVFLDDLTLDAADAARVIADRKTVRLEVAEFEEAAVDGDASLLRQLVIILLDNAIKFTDPEGVVSVSVRAELGKATLTVADSGIGITAEQLPHVFERFYRGDPARTRDGSGSQGAGLGLSIAQWVADEHGATLTIDSQSGQGTRVVVEFPPAVSPAS